MVSGDLDITIKLNRDGSPYPAQEDVLIKVAYKALANSPVPAPYLVTHPVTWILKDLNRKSEKRVDFVPPAPHGVPRFEEFPAAPVDPAHPVTYTLRVQTALGFLAEGKYSLRISVSSPAAQFASDWMEFEVSPMNVQAPCPTPSSEGAAGFLHLTWREDGAKPPAIMLKEMFIGKGHELMPRTFAVGVGDAASAPIASTAPAGRDPDVFWIGWLAKDHLVLSRVFGDAVQATAIIAPAQADFSLIPSLAYHDKPDGSDPRLAGALSGRDKQGAFLIGFQGTDAKALAWTRPLRLSGELLATKLVAFSATRRVLLTARRDAAALKVEAMVWDEGQAFQPEIPLLSLPHSVATGFRAFDAVASNGAIHWSLLLHQPAINGDAARHHVWSHTFNAAGNRTGAGVPKSTSYSVLTGPVQPGLELDAAGTPWILQRDVHGAWAQSRAWPDPIAVATPRGSRYENLYFRRGELPRVSLLDPDAGFANQPVILPTVEPESDDEE
jgi:hypothetical protein